MFLPPGADNPSYTTASARQCKCGRFSLPPYETRKSTEMSASRPAASDGGPVDFRYPASAAGQRLRPQPAFQRVRRRSGRCPVMDISCKKVVKLNYFFGLNFLVKLLS